MKLSYLGRGLIGIHFSDDVRAVMYIATPGRLLGAMLGFVVRFGLAGDLVRAHARRGLITVIHWSNYARPG